MQNLKSYKQPVLIDFGNRIDVLMTGFRDTFSQSLDESERGEQKVGLKLNIQKTKIMASGPITSWQTAETVSDFIFGGSKITADDDWSYEIKTLTPWKESYDQP